MVRADSQGLSPRKGGGEGDKNERRKEVRQEGEMAQEEGGETLRGGEKVPELPEPRDEWGGLRPPDLQREQGALSTPCSFAAGKEQETAGSCLQGGWGGSKYLPREVMLGEGG